MDPLVSFFYLFFNSESHSESDFRKIKFFNPGNLIGATQKRPFHASFLKSEHFKNRLLPITWKWSTHFFRQLDLSSEPGVSNEILGNLP